MKSEDKSIDKRNMGYAEFNITIIRLFDSLIER